MCKYQIFKNGHKSSNLKFLVIQVRCVPTTYIPPFVVAEVIHSVLCLSIYACHVQLKENTSQSLTNTTQ